MNKENKPTSRVINIYQIHHYVTHLCEDGSVWNYYPGQGGWECILEAGYDKPEKKSND
jgi:hypothetical protein